MLKQIAADHGLDAKLGSPHSLRDGCDATLYADGVDPLDIQRWNRREAQFPCAIFGMDI